MEDADAAFAQLHVADGLWEAAIGASAMAPPDPGFADRLRAIASAAEQEAAAFRLADARQLAWQPLPEARGMSLSYELRTQGRRPGSSELWDRFDEAVADLATAFEGVALSAVARAFTALSDVAHTIADELG